MSDALDAIPDHILAERYRWFCRVGWKRPTLNHPVVIHGEATPEQIDLLIVNGLLRHSSKSPAHSCPTQTFPTNSAA